MHFSFAELRHVLLSERHVITVFVKKQVTGHTLQSMVVLWEVANGNTGEM